MIKNLRVCDNLNQLAAEPPYRLTFEYEEFEPKKLQAEIRKNERILEKSEAEIEKLDEEKAKLDEEAAGSAATNYVRLSEISARIAEIDKRTEELFLAMMEAEEFLASVKE